MSSPRWERIKEIVAAALELEPSERGRFLDDTCPDSDIRKEVESLLAREREGFLERPASARFEEPEEPTQKTSTSSDLEGTTLSHYEIREKLGEGGMGQVFLAQDRSLDRRVALKLLAAKLEGDETAKKRFLREAKSSAALDHPYICKIYEIGEAEGKSFIAMEYVVGETLRTRLERKALPLAEVRRIGSEIAEALETAHQEDIVHRDLKPSNIMLTTGGHVKVLDFGLAKRVTGPGADDSQLETESQLTGEGMMLGTVAYMSPEQLRNQTVDARSDIFSFGIVLYEMLAGGHPFTKATSMDTAASILNLAPPPLERTRPDAPELLGHIVSKMLVKEPEERYQLVHEVRTDLDRVGLPARRAPALSIPRLGKRQLKIGAAALAALTLAAALALWWSSLDGPSTSRDDPPSVAVLPLTNISEDPLETDYLAAGISQAVTNKLTQVGLRVTPWATARRYRDSDRPAEAIAQELNVDAVLVGTFQIAGDQILTNISLIDAESGFQSWADVIVEPYEDIFRMQLRLATGVAESLKKELTGEEETLLSRPESRSVDAYDFYLQGAHLLLEDGQESREVAFHYFTRAVELDPGLTEAHIGLGAVHWERYFSGTGGPERLDQSEESFEAALELNPASMRARRGLMLVKYLRGSSEAVLIQGAEAERLGRRDDVETLLARAEAYQYAGLHERSFPLLRHVIELDPANEPAYYHLVFTSWFTEPQQSIDVYRTYVRRFGEYDVLQSSVATAHYLLGNHEKAREYYEEALEGIETSSRDLQTLFFAGLFYDAMGERGRAEEVWYRGIEVTRLRLESYPDNVAMRLFLASFYGLIGDDESFLAESRRALEVTDMDAYALPGLAAVHARRGESERAVEILRRSLHSGRIEGTWRAFLQMAGTSPDSPPSRGSG